MYRQFVFVLLLVASFSAHAAQVLPEAVAELHIPLAIKPLSRPMTVAYAPDYSRYFIADGGLAPMPNEFGAPISPSQVHAYSDKGEYLYSAKPGLDNRSIYYNPNTHHLEVVTYNISSGAGFTPGSGVFAFKLDDAGKLTDQTDEITGPNSAFGSAATMPAYNPAENVYYAKQERSDKVRVVSLASREPIGEITLDLNAAGVKTDETSEHFIAYTGVAGDELALLDVDHKAVLVFDLNGKFVGKSTLPVTMKLRANNHYSGLGYANNLFFVYHEPEGEFGTYYGFRIFDKP
ncbi:MAG: hypothetical protein LBE24_05705 [Methylobacillus sp.]|jgi:hypothetical protein|nr:hypothetical protein [Methylobacillus sp.]